MPEAQDDFDVQLHFGPPPVLPDVEKQLKEYILVPDHLLIHDYERAQQFWKRVPNPRIIFRGESSPVGTTLKVDRDFTTGEVLQFREVPIEDMGCTAKNSLSLRRAPQPYNESVRGNDSNFPFLPAGFPEFNVQDVCEEQDGEVNFEDDLLSIPPGCTNGIEFKADGRTRITEEDRQAQNEPEPEAEPQPEKPAQEEPLPAVDLMQIMKQEEDLLGLWKEGAGDSERERKGEGEKMIIQTLKISEEEDVKVIPTNDTIPVLRISKAAGNKDPQKAEWAEEIDISQPVRDFHQKIPKMAHDFPFDLDIFQQQAILKVEEHSNVFVAAHTSAGKTVVAEYAIAMSQAHRTKTIYTSPIKALSNQKFRDFKATFGDVGLITGDIQLNQQATCLIMTTEILRSMLYQGSDVVRDLEFVIFDEVHYINNAERGHVWEEVLILLPEDVCIIMLSATVPNPVEFANWVGRTKQKMMYVITTRKRPVPLEHYLYTASGGRSKNERFLILDGSSRFQEAGYLLAKEAKDGKKKGSSTAPKGPMKPSAKQDATMLVALVDHLRKDKRLPVIAFTLSRNRCDTNARSLTNVDLTTAKQKYHIRTFFRKCLEKLKEPDRELPQVRDLEDMLMRGIGIHHSGILPILKEIVEMLFQDECVKLLFATETFAMGVNMPARTVVFDTIRKFNGFVTQTLMPAEYIQMAGRAGRRGLDTSGTVIILCKNDVPKVEDLKAMMLGKPEELTSQFRLTYSMILRCLRLEKISVEEIMSRSFMEFGKQSKQNNYKKEMKLVEEQIEKMQESALNSGRHIIESSDAKLSELYTVTSEYLAHWHDTRAFVLAQRAQKELTVGRVILVTYEEHVNKLAIILKTEVVRRENRYQVLILCNSEGPADGDDEIKLTLKTDPRKEKENEEKKKKPVDWYKMLGLIFTDSVFIPNGIGGHTVISVSADDIIDISSKVLKINAEIIINDWQQRQLPRFRENMPGPTCSQAVTDLTQMSLNYREVAYLQIGANRVKNPRVAERIRRMDLLMDRIRTCDTSEYPNFEEDFERVFQRKELEKKRDDLKYLQSNKSMRLYPDYQSKVEVLRSMKYIDENNAVTMKGRVAIKMRNHELIITELVLRNILSDMQASEIAALLSSLVFQQKRNKDAEEPEPFISTLQKGKECIQDIERSIRREEERCGVQADLHSSQELNFELVNVVYDWARGEPFKHIMLQTDVQEGIIVRCIQQLHEMLRDVKDAAQIYGDSMLGAKMEEAQRAIKRDIVFAASLYTSESTFPKPSLVEDGSDMSKRELS